MKNLLTQYRNEKTPFLNRVRITDNPIGKFRKIGFGPRFKKDKELAEEQEGILISSYIDAWIRGKLYLHAPDQKGFKPVRDCGCTLIDQTAQRYPMRAGHSGKPVNPMVISEGVASVSFMWIHAPQEFLFAVNQDVVELDGSVNRELVEDCYRFEIELSIHIPQNSVCIERIFRPLTNMNFSSL